MAADRGLRGPLKRVVVLYPERHSVTEAFCFGTVDGENWYGLRMVDKPQPGDLFDGVPAQGEHGITMPMSMTYRWLAMQGRVEEVTGC